MELTPAQIEMAIWDDLPVQCSSNVSASGQRLRCLSNNRCSLCEVALYGEYELRNHCLNMDHQKRVMAVIGYRQQYLACVRDRLSNFAQLRAPTKGILSSSAKLLILETLVDYMLVDVGDMNANFMLFSTQRMIENAMFWDRVATFKLALWKFACIRSLQNTNVDIAELMHWFGKGWKKAMKAQLQSNVFSIIVPLVLPFLETPGAQQVPQGIVPSCP